MAIPDPPHADDRDLFDRLAEHHGVHVDGRHRTRPRGRGGFATVYEGRLGDRPCAVKVWNQSAGPDDPAVRREVEALGELLAGDVGRLPNVVTLLREPIWEYDHAAELVLSTVWELADGTLQDLLRSVRPDGLPRETVVHFLEDVARGLDDLADLGQTHRDVKPANVLLFGNRAKLGDFGLARLIGASTVQTTGVRGTLEFMPPEALVGSSPEVSPTFDAYAFGVTYAYLRRGRTVFGDGVGSSTLLNLHLVQRLAEHKQQGAMQLDGLDDDEADLVRALCAPNAADRPRERLTELFARLKNGAFGHDETPEVAAAPPPEDELPDTGAWDPASDDEPDVHSDAEGPDDVVVETLDVTEAFETWQQADEAVLDACTTFGEIESELLAEQRKRDALLQTYVAGSQTVRQQDESIAEVTQRLEQQQRLVSRRLRERDAADAGVCRAIESQIAGLDREVERLTDPERGLGYRREAVPVQGVQRQIDELRERQRPHLDGRKRAAGEQPRIRVREFLEEPANLIGRRTTTFGVELLRLPAGEFLRGSPDGEGETDERPQRLIRITQPFWIGKYPVTVGQVLRWLNDPGVKFEASWIDLADQNCPVSRRGSTFERNTNSKFGRSADQPMVLISWEGSLAYCAWATRQDPGFRYTLPTEAQWEYACRAGTSRRFHWGDDEERLGEFAWHSGNSDGTTHPVGGKQPNVWGVHDLHHVWQWCWDWYDSDYYASSPDEDPIGPSAGSYRSGRGGGWRNSYTGYFRAACRDRISPSSRLDSLGFRLAAVPASE